jgi:hypothetical protein
LLVEDDPYLNKWPLIKIKIGDLDKNAHLE